MGIRRNTLWSLLHSPPGLLLVIALLALTARWPRLGLPELSADESFSWRLTQYAPADLVRATAHDVHPPLYYLLLQAWMAAWGSTPAALRGFSLCCGVLCVPVIYLLGGEALRRTVPDPASVAAARGGALLSAAVLALHSTAILPARTARMYSLGMLLAGLSAWLLLRAMRARCGREWWWSAYGLTVAAFCYTHYYAFFTILAQTLFVVGDLALRVWRQSLREAARTATGFLFAATIPLLLYAPWLPIWRQQVQDVRRAYWIPDFTVADLRQTFLTWLTGVAVLERVEAWCWMGLLMACLIWLLLLRCDRGAWFFFLLGAVPWASSVTLSLTSGQSILMARYLTFAHLGLLGFWGIVYARLPGWTPRLLLAGWLGVYILWGLHATAQQWPAEPPALAAAADFLRQQARPGDLFLTDGASAVNRLRYYVSQAGAEGLRIQCQASPLGTDGHITHIASLSAEDFFWEDDNWARRGIRRVWKCSAAGGSSPPRAGWKEVERHTFTGGGNTHYELALYEHGP